MRIALEWIIIESIIIKNIFKYKKENGAGTYISRSLSWPGQ